MSGETQDRMLEMNLVESVKRLSPQDGDFFVLKYPATTPRNEIEAVGRRVGVMLKDYENEFGVRLTPLFLIDGVEVEIVGRTL